MAVPALIISDLHLGAPHSALNLKNKWNPSEVEGCVSGREARDRLLDRLESLAGGEKVQRLVLLGDILDLSHGEFGAGLRELGSLLSEIWDAIEVEELVYVPGNHDRHWWTLQCEYHAMTKPLLDNHQPKSFYLRTTDHNGRTTNLGLIATPLKAAIRDLSLRVAYPDFGFKVGNTFVRLHHGHSIQPLWTLLYRVLSGLQRDLMDSPLASKRDPDQSPTDRQARILGTAAKHLGDSLEVTLKAGGAIKRELVDRLSGAFADLDWLITGQTGLLGRRTNAKVGGLGRALMQVFEDPRIDDRDKEDVLTAVTELIGLELQDAFSPRKELDDRGVPRPHSYSNNALKTQVFREIGEIVARSLVSAGRESDSGATSSDYFARELPEIQRYLLYYGKPRPDIFVYGHTHRLGRSKLPPKTDVFNTGGWVASGLVGISGGAVPKRAIPQSAIVRVTKQGKGELHPVDLSGR